MEKLCGSKLKCGASNELGFSKLLFYTNLRVIYWEVTQKTHMLLLLEKAKAECYGKYNQI